MSKSTSQSVDRWLELDCPRCKGKFRIKSAFAHMSGRCPHCGMVIEPPRPAPAPSPATFDSDEPLGLVPIEEEWPEPAQIDVDDREHYGFGNLPSEWAGPKLEKSPDVQAYGFGESAPAHQPDIAEMDSVAVTKEVAKVEPGTDPLQARGNRIPRDSTTPKGRT